MLKSPSLLDMEVGEATTPTADDDFLVMSRLSLLELEPSRRRGVARRARVAGFLVAA